MSSQLSIKVRPYITQTTLPKQALSLLITAYNCRAPTNVGYFNLVNSLDVHAPEVEFALSRAGDWPDEVAFSSRLAGRIWCNPLHEFAREKG
jgi:hypothetical protein